MDQSWEKWSAPDSTLDPGHPLAPAPGKTLKLRYGIPTLRKHRYLCTSQFEESNMGVKQRVIFSIITTCADRLLGGYHSVGELLKFHISFKMKLSGG